MTTWCEDCDHVWPESRKEHPRRWLCMKAPRLDRETYYVVHGMVEDPYYRCITVNTIGECPMFTPRRTPDDPK